MEQALEVSSDISRRPGFLLRRAHQIASALIMEETASLHITPTQYGFLNMLAVNEPIDQIGVARLLKLDRSTTGLVVKNLEDRQLIQRAIDPDDRRRRVLRITKKGQEILAQLHERSDIGRQRLLAPFNSEEAKAFLDLLNRFVDVHEKTKSTGTDPPVS